MLIDFISCVLFVFSSCVGIIVFVLLLLLMCLLCCFLLSCVPFVGVCLCVYVFCLTCVGVVFSQPHCFAFCWSSIHYCVSCSVTAWFCVVLRFLFVCVLFFVRICIYMFRVVFCYLYVSFGMLFCIICFGCVFICRFSFVCFASLSFVRCML